MKKKGLLIALAAFVPFSDALALTRTDGSGQAILLPYYSAAEGEATLFSVTNHTDQAKAIRVVIAEGRNGRSALGFNVYLAPYDSWKGAIAAGNQGPPVLVGSDESCTVPTLLPSLRLSNAGYVGSRDDELSTGADITRLQYGSIEIIELGVPTGTAAQLIEMRQCGSLFERFLPGGAWRLTPNAEIDPPAGGLTGEAQIIDVAAGVAYRSDAVVLDDFSFAPRHARPDSTDSNTVRFYKPTVSPTAGEFAVHGARIPIDRPADAVSLALMSTTFEAGYLLGEALDASTRMVITLPTRAAYLDNLPGGELPVGTAPMPPFTGASGSTPYIVSVGSQSINHKGELGGDEEMLWLTEQVNVIDLGHDYVPGVELVTGNDTGRMRIDLRSQLHTLQYDVFNGDVTEPHLAHGLPAVVQSLSKVRNADAQPGVLASYAISHPVLRETDFDTSNRGD